jgi:hypothetical protein
MNKRSRLAALVGAGILTFAAVGAVAAVKPDYAITVTKTASPATVPSGGASVTFTIWVANAGLGNFHTVNVGDSLAGCSAVYASGDTDSNGFLDTTETWSYTCTVALVLPNTTNIATVNACHNNSDCNQSAHDATGTGQVTVTLSNGGGGTPGATGLPGTDTLVSTGQSGPADIAWLLIAALGVLLGSLVVLSPSRVGRRR